jgi:hypothetical protein
VTRTNWTTARVTAVVAALLVTSAGCGSDDTGAAGGPRSTVATTTTPPTTTPPTTTPPTTTPPTTTVAVTTTTEVVPATTEPDSPGAVGTAAPAAIVPVVVCLTFEQDVAFGYTNEADEVIVLAAADSRLDNSVNDDSRFVPRVFVPGTVTPAFFAVTADVDALPEWTVVGPDGVTRTATPDADTPSCENGLGESGDDREPGIEVGDPVRSADGSTFTFTAQVVDLPATSVCPEGLEPLAPEVFIDRRADGDQLAELEDLVEGDSATLEWAVPFGYAAATVIDRCAAPDGTVQSVWTDGSGVLNLREGFLVCLFDDPGPPVLWTEGSDPRCVGLPGTGGGRSRPS